MSEFYVKPISDNIVVIQTYVKEFHTTGTTWNPNGVDFSEYSASAANSPPPAAAPKPAAAKPAASAAAPKANLFAELSKEGSVTSGLRTVTKDQQTWRKEYAGECFSILVF